MVRKARGLREIVRDESRHRYKKTAQGKSRNTRINNKHKRRQQKVNKGNGRIINRGQG